MSEDGSNVVPMVSRAGRLADALQRVRAREQARARDAMAARDGRLEALADDLRAMADELPAGEGDRFAFVPAQNGERLTIDAQSFVDLHPETLDYRLVRQDRDGPDVIAESSKREAMADSVADYVAERIVQREGLAGATSQSPVARTPSPTAAPAPATTPAVSTPVAASPPQKSRFWVGFWWFVLGGVCSATALFTYAWLQAGPPG
ncbi:MAG: hypothetical protein JJ908_08340 [Rhizobiales bacterium]|nr:hypothetical protein [Hyphomicrobiales bacterium]MBO6697382.1 hypothetical protein [Hyphomicrobiales bacterium]MBO6736363.1 hypothetical protein [Hyphomicrobiales bacterium]MBO6912833.1 hypothetical protein [Hyphomicrobiales bacterium]MBO6954001.1 hypothetical protein [Hyphomicrobiales bacterium]